jgi:isoleucyl-tRNA synthetase
MLDENGHEMHGSQGNAIEATDAFARMGADVMRWQYCAQPPNQNLLFGFGPAEQIKRELLTLWNSVVFFISYANIDSFRPTWPAVAPHGELAPLDHWLVERTHAFVREAEAAYEAFMTVDVIHAYEAYVDDLSNWYIRRSRRRFWNGERVALETLWYALVQTLRVLSPVMPFLTEHLWRNLVPEGPESVHLSEWPDVAEPNRALLDEIADVRRVVTLAHQARATSGLKLRQPLRRLVVEGAPRAEAYADEIADEVRVKEVAFDQVDAEVHVKPNLPVLGPRLGKELRAVQQALQAGEFEELDDGRFRAAGHELAPDEVIVERGGREGSAVASADGVTVALELGLDDELLLEGRGYDLIRQVNSLRRDEGLELTDRIVLTLPQSESELVDRHGDWIKDEVLAVEIRLDGNLRIDKA